MALYLVAMTQLTQVDIPKAPKLKVHVYRKFSSSSDYIHLRTL